MRLIDADVLRETMKAVLLLSVFSDETEEDKQAIKIGEMLVRGLVDEQPTIDAAPVVHAKWVHGITNDHEWRKCSECLVTQNIFGCFTYCPNCGAKMDERVNGK